MGSREVGWGLLTRIFNKISGLKPTKIRVVKKTLLSLHTGVSIHFHLCARYMSLWLKLALFDPGSGHTTFAPAEVTTRRQVEYAGLVPPERLPADCRGGQCVEP